MTANAVHPGLVRTSLMQGAPAPLRWAVWPFSRDPRAAVQAIVPLVLAPEFADRSGRSFHKAREIEPPKSTSDPETARRLWDACARLTGV